MNIITRLTFTLLIAVSTSFISFAQSEMAYFKLEEYPHGIKNPMKGFGIDTIQANHPLATVVKTYIPWNVLEDDPEDGVQKIIDYCNIRWREFGTYKNVPNFKPKGKLKDEFQGTIPETYDKGNNRTAHEVNVRIVPRVYLQYAPKSSYSHFNKYTESRDVELAFPKGMERYDYYSDNFCSRVNNLTKKLAEAWDNDPRVMHVEIGIIGLWGEQHTPFPTEKVQNCVGDAFSISFINKHVLRRWSHHFQEYDFGVYADSWGHDQDRGHDVALLGDLWKTKPITGEIAYDWGRFLIQPGRNPDSTVMLKKHREYIISSIRTLHCSYLFWVGRYNWRNPATKEGADEMQKAFGYRYVIDTVGFSRSIENNSFKLHIELTNTGSAPFYYDYPMEVSLLDKKTKKKVWGKTLNNVDIKKWLSGNFWNPNFVQYMEKAKEHSIDQTIKIDKNIPKGEYIIALSINDPSCGKPAIRFANSNYINGGYCPIGVIGNGKKVKSNALNLTFDDINADVSINYVNE